MEEFSIIVSSFGDRIALEISGAANGLDDTMGCRVFIGIRGGIGQELITRR